MYIHRDYLNIAIQLPISTVKISRRYYIYIIIYNIYIYY